MASSELYPDVVEAGGLDAALSLAFERIRSSLAATGLPKEMRFVSYGRIERGNRFSQVYIAKDERLFLFDFWRDGVHLADARTADIEETARAIDKWIAANCTLGQLAELPIVSVTQSAKSYDQGTEVRDRWDGYLRTIGDDFPELVAFVTLAAAAPELRQLFPYTSLNRFCFSRCTGYPFTRDMPHVHPQANGTYNVLSAGNKLIGNGDASSAVRLVIQNLPRNCGPAVRGTAETMNAT